MIMGVLQIPKGVPIPSLHEPTKLNLSLQSLYNPCQLRQCPIIGILDAFHNPLKEWAVGDDGGVFLAVVIDRRAAFLGKNALDYVFVLEDREGEGFELGEGKVSAAGGDVDVGSGIAAREMLDGKDGGGYAPESIDYVSKVGACL